MAFEFFRRRQKLVLIIMVVLMASFGLGSWGLNQFFGGVEPGEHVLATTSAGELRDGDIWAAESDLNVLRYPLRLGDLQRMRAAAVPSDIEYLTLVQGNERSDIAYALLQKGAADVEVLDPEIDRFFAEAGMPVGSEPYRVAVSLFKTHHGAGEKHLRRIVGRWLKVHKAYEASLVEAPPSEPELRRLFRDLSERIAVEVARVSAEDFVDQVSAPTDEELQAQFEQYQAAIPGRYTPDSPFGFGYLQPDRLAVAYLLINGEAVARVTAPSDKDVRDYYRDHRQEFTVEAPAGEDTAFTQPAAPQIMEFSEAKGQIVELLKDQAVTRKLDDLTAAAESLLARYAKEGAGESGPYGWIVSQMTAPAEQALALPVTVRIQNQRLDEAMDLLAEATGLRAICFPYGKTDAGELDPAVRVTLSLDGATLGEALAAVSKQVAWPSTEWITCDGFEGVIFPASEEVGLAPVRAGRTALADYQELLENDLLVRATTSARQPLLVMAFQAEPFAKRRNQVGLVRVAQEAPRMILQGEPAGRMLWRVSEAEESHIPEQLTDRLRPQVAQDVMAKKAYDLALAWAGELLTRAQAEGLSDLAEAEKMEAKATDLFARMVGGQPGQMIFFQALQSGLSQEEAMVRAILAPPVAFEWNVFPDVALPNKELRKGLVEAAFALAPADVEPAEGEQPYPSEPAAGIAEVPSRGEILLMQRADYRPAVAGEFEAVRNELAAQLSALQQWQTRKTWFDLNAIQSRLDFQVARPEE